MVNKRWMNRGRALLLCALMLAGQTAYAEEKRLGDFIYVPAMTVQPQTGSIALRVEGLALDADADQPRTVDALPGAVFGVYVISGDGELTPWANPLYPSEPMRIRTGESETRFALPAGTEFYLIQESAPKGYLLEEALVPVSGDSIVIRNAMEGELLLSAVDSLGVPLAGVTWEATAEDGTVHTLVSGNDGCAVLKCDMAQRFTIVQKALPQGVFAPLGVQVSGQAHSDLQAVSAQVDMAARTRVAYEHPAAGSVLLEMALRVIDGNADEIRRPLAGVAMQIEGDMLSEPMTIVTDENGQARSALMEGTYTVRLAYQGDEDAVLPLQAGQMVVTSGSVTLIELEAAQSTGRIAVQAVSERRVDGGSVTLISEDKGTKYGPYPLDAEGMAVSDPLPAGAYRVYHFEEPRSMQAAGAAFDGVYSESLYDLQVMVQAGAAAFVEIDLLTREKAAFDVLAAQVGEDGQTQYQKIEGEMTVALLDEDDVEVQALAVSGGRVSFEALSGEYTLRMPDKMADRLGVQPVSGLFALPSQEEAVVFASERTRVIISSVDEEGNPVSGAQYTLTDSTGARHDVTCDEDGMAVSEAMLAGSVRIETREAPAHHAQAETAEVQAPAGEALRVEMVHPSHGEALLGVRLQKLDERGRASVSALPGVSVSLYRVNGEKMTHTGIELTSGEDGNVRVQLEPGEYVAKVDADDLQDGYLAPQAVRFTAQNTVTTEGTLLCMDVLGGVRVTLTGSELTDEQKAQVRFEITLADGTVRELAAVDGAFYAGALAEGTYVLRQTQIPEGYTLAKERTFSVNGGRVTEVSVPLEEYALLSVSKTGLTFDDSLKTYVVPLSGEYGVFTRVNGELKPYPNAGSQLTVWSNVMPAQGEGGKTGVLRLPASIEGTTYYLHELGDAQGFASDDNYYEVTIRAGESVTIPCTVSSDRGFFSLSQLDAADGAHVAGGRFELASEAGVVLEFEMEGKPYRNPMAIPVGEYVLRHVSAAPGYALSRQAEIPVTVEPYLTQGGLVTEITVETARIPESDVLGVIGDVYAAREQNLTLLTIDMNAMHAGETLLTPVLLAEVSAVGAERTDIAGVVIAGAGDAKGGSYIARVEYCLEGGGWQPSDARMTGVLSGPTAVSLADVHDDISAVRITYMNAETGEEAVDGGFMPGQITLNVEAGASGTVDMLARTSFGGVYAYRTEKDGELYLTPRSAERSHAFAMQADAPFDTVCAGRDGRISGFAFFDEDADGVIDAEETGRYAGMNVSLLTASGDVADTARTGADGSYRFDGLSGGEYTLQFDAGEAVVFSGGELFSQHKISGVRDMRYGMSAPMTIDGSHTDYVVHVGCIYASDVQGAVVELLEQGSQAGFGGLSVEMRPVNAGDDEEPLVVMTDGMGRFGFTRILPGEYEIAADVPQGYLCKGAEDGRFVRNVVLEAGSSHVFDPLLIQRASGVSGFVMIDDDGDGVIGENAAALEGVGVALVRMEDGHTSTYARTETDADGAYAFDGVEAGTYSVLFELNGEWAFTRYGEDSSVYGAVSQSGSTRSMTIEPGQDVTGVNAGVTIPARMTVSVFKDTQFDGQKGAYEEMLEGVSISLIHRENGEDAEEITYKTDAQGTVVFDGVSPGEYVIAYQMPGQWRSTKQVDPATTSYRVSGVPQSSLSTGRSEPFMLTMGQTSMRMDIGAMLSGSISGVVYYDDDANVALGSSESYCEGVKVELLTAAGQPVGETTSGSDGSYAFEGLAPGRYRVRFTAEEGCGFSGTERTAGRGGVLASEKNMSLTRTIAVSNGSATDSADAGVVRLGSVSGVIWEDQDADCIPADAERPVAGVKVSLMNGAGRTVIATTDTDGEGRFAFDGVRPDTYKLRVDAPEGYVFSGALSGSPLPMLEQRDARAYSAPFTLLGGVNVDGIGYGVLTQGSISGRVWEDADFDGLMTETESGLRGAKVVLYDLGGAEVASVQTIRSGEFTFTDLMPGEYTAYVELPEGYVFTADGGDSLAPQDAGSSAGLYLGELGMGAALGDVNIGALRPAAVGGVVWYDQDDDGRRQTEDGGVAGVRAVLTKVSGRDAGWTAETVTDESGAYRFDGVMPGEVQLTFELAQGHAFARSISGTRRVSVVPMMDSLIAQTDVIGVTEGQERTDLDVGVVGVGTVSGRVWLDSTYDGKRGGDEAGVAGALVELVDARSGESRVSAHTDEQGVFEVPFARKGEYTARVTLPDGMIFTRSGNTSIADVDGGESQTAAFELGMGESLSGLEIGAIHPAKLAGCVMVDQNENGVQEAGEEGFEGAVVTAMQGGTVVATARTQADGTYAFNLLRPGTYRLRFVLDEDALFARGAFLNMTHADALEGETAAYDLAMGQHETVEAVPVVRSASISGRAWLDADVSGEMDAAETAIAGVAVQLLSEDGDVLIQSETGGDGAYAFERLRSGAYAVRFALPDGMLFTDHTGAPGGSCIPVTPDGEGRSETFALEMDQHIGDMNVGGILPGEIGDTVWLDKDGNGLQDYREPLVPDVALTLLRVHADGSMEEAAHTQSDKYGYYVFESLRPGTYVLRFDAKEGDVLTYHFGEPLGEIDSDIDPDTRMSAPVALRSGQVLRNIDVGLIEH